MENKTLETMLIEANKNVERLTYEETCNILKQPNTFIIDVREESEVANFGLIKNAIHIPRGLIEFKIELNSSNNPAGINNDSNLLFYCAGGFRSALAANTVKNLGFINVYNIGGFGEWVNNGGEIQPI
ncbi:MAG: rhodanese-like domain-containing protein [Gammaproteobacteria bacterium]|jgi:rhodanese-related sulfurtransferase